MDYYNTTTLEKNRRKTIMAYLTLQQKKDVVKDTNEVALYLLDYYYSKANTPNYDYLDERVAKALDWTTRKVGENRRKLEKAGYYKKVVVRDRSNSSTLVTLGHQKWSNLK